MILDHPREFETEYRLTYCTDDDDEFDTWDLTVAWRSSGSWAVLRHGRCLGSDGEWDREPSPSNRDDEWKAAHRFPLDDALRLAREALPHVTVNGHTARSWAAERAKRSTSTQETK